MNRILILMSVLGLLAVPVMAGTPGDAPETIVVNVFPEDVRPLDVTVLYKYDEQIPRDVEELYVHVYGLKGSYGEGRALPDSIASVRRNLAPTEVEVEQFLEAAHRAHVEALVVITPDPGAVMNGCSYFCKDCDWDYFSNALSEACRFHGDGKNLSTSQDGDRGKSSEATGTCADGTKIRIFCCSASRCSQ